MAKPYVSDEGTLIIVDAKTDISSATLLQLHVKKPDGTVFQWDAGLHDLTHAAYIVQPGDFDQPGTYYVQLYIDSPTWQGLGETTTIEVYDRFL